MSILRHILDLFATHAHHASREEMLDARAAEHKTKTGEALDWRNSVVDTMKLLKIDEAQTSFAERKKLAAYYDIPDYTGTAEQNRKLADALVDDLIG